MSFLNSKEDLVRQLVVARNLTAAQTSDELRRLFPEERGASVASAVRRFCSSHNIRRILTPLQRDVVIARCVAELGPSYGRKMLKGALTSRGIIVGERQIVATRNSTHDCCTANEHARPPCQPYALLGVELWSQSAHGSK